MSTDTASTTPSNQHATQPTDATGSAQLDDAAPISEQAAQAPSLADAPTAAASSADAPAVSTDQVKLALRRVKDPELNLNIVDLGLVYDIAVEGSEVRIDMTLTSPGCPSGPEIMNDAEKQVRTLDGVSHVAMNLVWAPYWTPERIEPRVRAYLGF